MNKVKQGQTWYYITSKFSGSRDLVYSIQKIFIGSHKELPPLQGAILQSPVQSTWINNILKRPVARLYSRRKAISRCNTLNRGTYQQANSRGTNETN